MPRQRKTHVQHTFKYRDVPVVDLGIDLYATLFDNDINQNGRYEYYRVEVQQKLFDPFNVDLNIKAYKPIGRRNEVRQVV